MKDIHRIDQTACPCCGKKLDAVSQFQTDVPKPKSGDTSICFGCAQVSVFDDQLALRRPSAAQLAEMRTDPDWARDIAETQARIRAFNATHPR